MSAVWHVATPEGTTEGPLDTAGLARLVAAGRLTPETWVWREGMASWAAARDVPDVAHIVVPPVSPPRPAPAPARGPISARAVAAGAETPPAPKAVQEALVKEAKQAAAEEDRVTPGFALLLAFAFSLGFGIMAAYLRLILPKFAGG